MLGEAFLRGLSLLKSYQLTYDFLIFPHQLPAAIEVAQKFPEQKLVLDHLAKPPIKSGEIEPWKQSLQRLAKLPNVSCKVSGMLTEANHQHWKPDDFRPYFDVVFEAFTPARLMYGSDWPVCLFAGQYEQAFHLVEAYARHLSSTDQQGLWGENAARFYLQR
jgi:L-fuconolactonase